MPDNAPVIEQAKDRAMRRAAQRFNAVARLEGGALAETFHDANHAIPVEHAGDIVGDSGRSLTLADGRQVAEDRKHQFAAYGREGVAVEEQEGCPTVKGTELVN